MGLYPSIAKSHPLELPMPIHLPPINRRRFLSGTLAAGASMFLPRHLLADQPADPNHFVLLADTHICDHRDTELRGVKPVVAFEQLGKEIIAASPRAAGAIVAGDCAFLEGKPADYAMIDALVRPLRRAGLPMHFTLGNHDHRDNFMAAFPDATWPSADPLPPNKLVSMLETPHANWFLLDSLDRTNVTPGLLGQAQLTWLARALDARPSKPALVVAHHNPQSTAAQVTLVDTQAFFDVLLPRKQVKAYFFGHTHRWQPSQHEGLHLVNLPAVAWLFDPTQPRGFVAAQLHPTGVDLELNALDPQHPKHGEKIALTWRAA